MGGNITNVSGSANRVIVESSIGGDIFEEVRDKHGEYVASALKDLAQFVQRQQDSAAAENFTLMAQAIARCDNTPEVARKYWDRITAAIPAILQSPAAGALVGSILR